MRYILIPIIMVVLASAVFAASLDARLTPETVSPGGDQKLIISTVEVPNGKWFVAFDVAMDGGCVRKENSQTEISDFMLDEVSADQTKEYNIQTPETGECGFDITYQFTGGEETVIELPTEAAEVQPEAVVQPEAEPTAEEQVEEEAETVNYTGLIIAVIIIVIFVVIVLLKAYKKKTGKEPLKKK